VSEKELLVKIDMLEKQNKLLQESLRQAQRISDIGRQAINELKESKKALQLSAQVMHYALEAIVITNAEGVIEAINPAFTMITGYEMDEVAGEKIDILNSGKHNKKFFEVFWKTLLKDGHWRGEIYNKRKDGEIFPTWQTVSAIYDKKNNIVNYVSIFTDITQRKLFEKNLDILAHYDGLTGLPNRLLFQERLKHAVKTADRYDLKLVVFFLDLDYFKEVNDTMGHDGGDILLQQVAHRLESCLRKEDTIARLGGDEFACVLNRFKNKETIALVAEKMVRACMDPFEIKHKKCQVGVSIGISVYPDDAKDLQKLVKQADEAMYFAKQAGRNQYKFYHDM